MRREENDPTLESETLRPLAELQDAIMIKREQKIRLPPVGECVVLERSEAEHIRSRLRSLTEDSTGYASAGWAMFGMSGSAAIGSATAWGTSPTWLIAALLSFVVFGGAVGAILLHFEGRRRQERGAASERVLSALSEAITRAQGNREEGQNGSVPNQARGLTGQQPYAEAVAPFVSGASDPSIRSGRIGHKRSGESVRTVVDR
jgi:hypothetical protein